MYPRVNITAGKREGVLLVPKAALLDDAAGSLPEVVVVESGIAQRRRVSIGLQNDQFVEILNGLHPGDLVATSALADLADGQSIKVTPTTH
jgi:multidrug efflux pump subunit AcrA (membrane-fusion protein)